MSERPQPLHHLPAPRLRAVHGVLTDIDDTLTRAGTIEPAALSALHALHDAGVPVIAVTGRPARWSEPCARTWPVAAIVAENGGVVLRRMPDAGLQLDFAQSIAERAGNAERLQRCLQDVLARVPGAAPAADSSGRLTDIAIDHAEHARLDAPGIASVVALMRAHGLNVTVSSIHVNGWIGAHDKWTGAQTAVRLLYGRPLDPQGWLVVGDSSNDEPLFERVALSVAVANIAPFLAHLRTKPAYITRGERGAGFAELARALLAARTAPAP